MQVERGIKYSVAQNWYKGLDTGHPVGLPLYKGPVVCCKNGKKTPKENLVFCFILSFTMIFALFEY